MTTRAANAGDLLATAGTIEGIRDCVGRFYGGQSKTLIPTGDGLWQVIDTYSGAPSKGVRVRRFRRRFRFEMTPAT
jgi:hypothetical protein